MCCAHCTYVLVSYLRDTCFMVLTLFGKSLLLYHCLTFSSEILFATLWQCHQEGVQESSLYSWNPCFSGEESQLRELSLLRPCECSTYEGWGKEGSGVWNPEKWSCCCALSPWLPCPSLSVPVSEAVVPTWASVVHADAPSSLMSTLKLMHCALLSCLSLFLSAVLVSCPHVGSLLLISY